MLNISNNKKTSLAKSEIIVNIDFTKELLNKYRIYEKAIIFNILDKIDITRKRFSGVNINYYKISIPDQYKIDEFEDELVYESKIYSYNNLEMIRKIIKKDEIVIHQLTGINGVINESELA